VRGMFVKALIADGLSLDDLRRKRQHRKGSSLIPNTIAEHIAQGYRNIASDAALSTRAPPILVTRPATRSLRTGPDRKASIVYSAGAHGLQAP